MVCLGRRFRGLSGPSNVHYVLKLPQYLLSCTLPIIFTTGSSLRGLSQRSGPHTGRLADVHGFLVAATHFRPERSPST